MKESPEGLILPIKVTPNARVNRIGPWQGDELEIKVTAIPDKGAANKAVIQLLSKTWKVAKSRIRILKGSTSRHKVLLIEAMTQDELPI